MKRMLTAFIVYIVCIFAFTKPIVAAEAPYSANIRVSPLGLLIGYVNVDADFLASDNWTLGPTVSYWSFKSTFSGFSEDISTTSYALGVRANWYKEGAYVTGLYVSPIIQYVSATAKTSNVSATATAVALSGIVGYHWFWDGFNLSLGGGIGSILGGGKVKVEEPGRTAEVNMTSSTGLAIDFMLGWAF